MVVVELKRSCRGEDTCPSAGPSATPLGVSGMSNLVVVSLAKAPACVEQAVVMVVAAVVVVVVVGAAWRGAHAGSKRPAAWSAMKGMESVAAHFAGKCALSTPRRGRLLAWIALSE